MKNYKRIMAAVMTAAMAAALLAGCGSSTADEASTQAATEGSTEAAAEKVYSEDAYTSGITASEYVTLPDYSEIPVSFADPREDVTDEAVENAVQSALQNDKELVAVTDRAVQDGDVVNIDYVGKMNGVAFDGGTDQGFDLTIGSNRFIDDFEEQLIGWEIGDSKTIEVTFPDPYDNNPDYAGKDATFDVTINSIQEYQTPEFTDAWVADQSIDGVTTTEEYTEYTREQLLADAQSEYDYYMQAYATQYVYDNATWQQEPPTAMVDRLYDSMIDQIQQMADAYSMDIETVVSYYGYDTETYEEELRTSATESARQSICLQAIADAEDLNLTDDEYQTQLETLASDYGYEDASAFEESYGESTIREYLMDVRVWDLLAGNAVYTAAAEDDSTETAAEVTTEAAEADTEAAEADTEAAEADTEAAAE